MAYVIVLEGQHKSGKSTLAAQLERLAATSGDWRSVVAIHHTRGDSTPEKLDGDRRMVADAPTTLSTSSTAITSRSLSMRRLTAGARRFPTTRSTGSSTWESGLTSAASGST